MKKTFYLIDGHSQIFRAYYAPYPPLTAPSGEPVKATYTFTQMLLGILKNLKPDYIAMALDTETRSTERAQLYPEYKQNRSEIPEDLPEQITRIVEIVGIMGIPVYQLRGYEADDLIATVADRIRGLDVNLKIVSRDKDLYQLLSDQVSLWDPQKDEIIDPARLEEKLGFRPDQSVEIQTLTGDSTDNVPGIPGIGPKTATKLIQKYGSADEVLTHAHELTPKQKANVLEFGERMQLTRKLVTLDRSVEMEFELEACTLKPLPVKRLETLFGELKLQRLTEQLEAFGPGGAAPAGGGGQQSTTTSPGHYTLVDTPEAFKEFLTRLSAESSFSVDTETTSLRPVDCDVVGFSFSWKSDEGYYLPIRSNRGATLDPEETVRGLKPLLEDPSIKKCGQNIKYDIQTLRTSGIELQGVSFDSMVASYLLRSGERGHDLDTLSRVFLGHDKIPTGDLIGKGSRQISMLDVEPRLLADYAGEDADMTWRLYEELAPRIEESPMRSLYFDVELPLVEVLADMEYEGVRIDCELLQRISERLGERIEALKIKIHGEAGREFSIDSPKQLAEVLFDEQKLRVVKKTKTSRSTDAGVLETLAIETAHPLPRLLLEYRELTKLRGTYVDPLPRLVSPKTERLHASFHQAVAATGRLSSSDPNIQNIPVRSAEGREIRKAFVPRDSDHVLVTADYSQIELRILAHLSRDEALVEAFRKDQDIHTFVAAQIAGVPLEEVTREQRSRAKAVNFGIIYGQGAFGLAKLLGISRHEAADFIALYKKRYPGIVSFMAECVAEADKTGKVSTLLGRQRAIPEILSRNQARRAQGERLAINTVIQGTAADMIKVAMVRVHGRIRGGTLPAKLIIQVHDELVLETHRDRAEETARIVHDEMMAALPLDVPLKVDVGWGDNWLAAGSWGKSGA